MSTDLPTPLGAAPSLADVVPSALASLGVRGFDDAIGLPRVDRVVVMVIDGLGQQQVTEFAQHAPFLASLTPTASQVTSAFPSTTPTGLTSIGTGLTSGEHGVAAAAFRLAPGEPLLRPLHWGSTPAPSDVQPNATAWEQASWNGVHVAAVSPRQYHESGLSAAALRGAKAVGGDSPGEVAVATAYESRQGPRSLVYAYHATLDRTGHVHGPGAPAYLADLAHVDLLVQRTAEALPSGTLLLVTADHGMVRVDPAGRIDITNDSALSLDIDVIGGEPRIRLLYVRRGATDDVVRRWTDRVGHAAWVLSVDDAIEAGWYGYVDPTIRPRLGDVVVAAKPGYLFVADFDRRTATLLGQHGSITPAEIDVPLLSLVV